MSLSGQRYGLALAALTTALGCGESALPKSDAAPSDALEAPVDRAMEAPQDLARESRRERGASSGRWTYSTSTSLQRRICLSSVIKEAARVRAVATMI
jgi:hypothetical protein